MNIARMRAGGIVLGLTLMGGFASPVSVDRPFKGLRLMSKQSGNWWPCTPRRRRRTTSRGWSWASTLTPIRVAPTAAS